jgi:hypothetical protein
MLGHGSIIRPWPCPTLPPITTTTTPRPLDTRSIGGYIERMWAYKSIKKMLDKAKYGGVDDTTSKKLNADALKLSLKVGRMINDN